jgi:hypothetical protein
MKKLFLFSVLLCLAFGFSSCLDNNDQPQIYVFYDEPAVYYSINDKPLIKTSQGWLFYAPSLATDVIEEGALLWTHFTVEKTEENYRYISGDTSCYIANSLDYEFVDSASIILPENSEEVEALLHDDYSEDIDRAVLYINAINKILFFGFSYDKTAASSHTYEIFLNPAEEHPDGFPVIYIRSKEIHDNVARRYNSSGETIFATDMSKFVDYYRKNVSDSEIIKFNIKYKVGNEDGNDIYREFKSNPLSWDIK